MKGLHFARPNVMPMSELNTRVRCINGSLPCSFLAYSLMSSVHVEEVADNGTTFKLVSIDTVVQQSAHQVEVNTEQQGWQSISSIYTAFDGDICDTLWVCRYDCFPMRRWLLYKRCSSSGGGGSSCCSCIISSRSSKPITSSSIINISYIHVICSNSAISTRNAINISSTISTSSTISSSNSDLLLLFENVFCDLNLARAVRINK